MHMRIIVIGAGIGGLAAALTLGRSGFEVQLFEQASELREVGAGVQLSPNATRILHRLGLEEPLRRSGVRPLARIIRRWDDGRVLAREPLAAAYERNFGAPPIITFSVPNCSTFFPRRCRTACFILTIAASA